MGVWAESFSWGEQESQPCFLMSTSKSPLASPFQQRLTHVLRPPLWAKKGAHLCLAHIDLGTGAMRMPSPGLPFWSWKQPFLGWFKGEPVEKPGNLKGPTCSAYCWEVSPLRIRQLKGAPSWFPRLGCEVSSLWVRKIFSVGQIFSNWWFGLVVQRMGWFPMCKNLGV